MASLVYSATVTTVVTAALNTPVPVDAKRTTEPVSRVEGFIKSAAANGMFQIPE